MCIIYIVYSYIVATVQVQTQKMLLSSVCHHMEVNITTVWDSFISFTEIAWLLSSVCHQCSHCDKDFSRSTLIVIHKRTLSQTHTNYRFSIMWEKLVTLPRITKTHHTCNPRICFFPSVNYLQSTPDFSLNS